MDYYGYSDYGYSDYEAVAGILGGIAIIGLILLLVGLAISIIQIIGLWKVFKKAGKGGWESIIPFYNNYVLVEIAGLNWWWFLFFFAPVVLGFFGLAWLGALASAFTLFNCYYNIAKRFNKSTGFAICLTIFTPICIPILGLSKNNVYNNIPVSNNGVFGPSGNNTNNSNGYNNNYNNMNNNVNYNYQNYNSTQPMYNNMNNIQESPIQNNMNNTTNQNDMNQTGINPNVEQFSFCGNCGTKLDSSIRFCPNCGKERV